MGTSLAWIETFTGVQFNLVHTRPEMIQVEDIAHSLSNMNRFTGHCRYPYSVAQHSLLGSYLIEDPKLAFRFLNHDDSEAYIGDMNRPLKHFTKVGAEFRKVEKPLQKMIYERFGIIGPDPKIIHEVDAQMLYAEKSALMGNTPFPVKWSKDEKPADVKIVEMNWRKVKSLWLNRFYELYESQY
jgi:hypothetical protein